MTEVFHINGESQDAGVVHNEMQARENTVGDLVDLAWVLAPRAYILHN